MISFSFVIPVFQEEKRVKKAISELLQSRLSHGYQLEKIIFVNDGSTDKTVHQIQKTIPAIEKKLKAKVEIISYKKNKGKGFAIRTGMLASSSDYTLFFDADMSTPLSEMKKFIPFMEKGIDVLVGTRKNGKATVVKYQPIYRQLLGKSFTSLSNIILQTNITDYTCGFKAFSNKAKNHIFHLASIQRWGYDAEILFLSQKFGYSLKEIPVVWANNTGSKVHLAKDIIYSFYELLTIRANSLLGKYENRPLLASSGIFATK